jgi:ketosteroid isomerase-like protein
MSDKADNVRGARHWPELTAVLLSILAVVFSGYALFAEKKQHSDERASELMAQIYSDWDQISLIDQWEVAHLIEVPETYEATRDRLRAYIATLPPRERARIEMQERLTVGRIFLYFEHHLNQWRVAREAGDEERLALLDVEMDFWFDEYLRNPRLLWFYSAEGGGMASLMDPPNRDVYEQRVLHSPDKPLLQQPDPVGIFLTPVNVSPTAASEELREQVTETEQAFAATMAARDHQAFVGFLAEDAIFFSGDRALRGRQVVSAAWRPYFDGPDAPFSWQPATVEVLDSGTLALSSGPVRDAAGKCLGSFQSIWRLEAPATWRIVFDKGNNDCPE